MNKTLRERQMEEALVRLEILKARGDIAERLKDGKFTICDALCNTMVWIGIDDADQKMVRKFEEENDALVYLVLRTYTKRTILDSLLFISRYTDEWEMERTDLDASFAFSFVVNHEDDLFSEFGLIMVKTLDDGFVVRIG